jgi:hypothetical protein
MAILLTIVRKRRRKGPSGRGTEPRSLDRQRRPWRDASKLTDASCAMSPQRIHSHSASGNKGNVKAQAKPSAGPDCGRLAGAWRSISRRNRCCCHSLDDATFEPGIDASGDIRQRDVGSDPRGFRAATIVTSARWHNLVWLRTPVREASATVRRRSPSAFQLLRSSADFPDTANTGPLPASPPKERRGEASDRFRGIRAGRRGQGVAQLLFECRRH